MDVKKNLHTTEEALNYLYKNKRVLISKMDVMNSEDSLQSCALSIIKHKGTIENVESFVKTALRNTYYKTNRLKSEKMLVYDGATYELAHNQSPEKLLQLKQNKAEINKVISSISEKQKQVLNLVMQTEQKLSDLATELNMSKDTFKANYRHALLRFRNDEKFKDLTKSIDLDDTYYVTNNKQENSYE